MVEYILVVLISLPLFVTVFSRYSKLERRYLWAGYGAHCVAAIVQLLITQGYYGGGDMIGYLERGQVVANMVRYGTVSVFDVFALAINQEPYSLGWVLGSGTSTGAMAAWSAILQLMTNNSSHATLLIVSLLAFSGQLAFYGVFRACLPKYLHRRALIATFLIPSVVFWTSGLLKEAFALCGLGWALYALFALTYISSRNPKYWVLLIVSAGLVGIFKAYALVPLAAGMAFWLLAKRSLELTGVVRFRVRYIVAALLLAVLGVVAIGEIFPRLAYESAIEETAQLQGAYRDIVAGSTYELGDPKARTLADQIQFIPLALFSALFRPLIVEVHNVTSLVNAIESTLAFLILIYVVIGGNLKTAREMFRTNPFMWFCLMFVLIFSVAVGLAAPNLGTLSRYRALMMPLYGVLLMGLLQRRSRPDQYR